MAQDAQNTNIQNQQKYQQELTIYEKELVKYDKDLRFNEELEKNFQNEQETYISELE